MPTGFPLLNIIFHENQIYSEELIFQLLNTICSDSYFFFQNRMRTMIIRVLLMDVNGYIIIDSESQY